MKMKNVVLTTITSLLLVGGCATIANNNSELPESTDVDGNKNVVTEINDVDDVYGVSALTSASLLTQFDQPVTVSDTTNNVLNLAWNEVGEVEIEKINSYINMFEGLLADEGVLSSTIQESDIETYDYMMTINVKDLLNEVTTYLMYFNEVVIEVEEPIDPEEPVEEEVIIGEVTETVEEVIAENVSKLTEVRDFDRLKDKIDEVSTKIEGIMIVGEETYDVVGTKIVNDSYIRTSFISMIDRWNYVRVTNTTNEGKETFKYRVVKDGRLASKSDVEIKNVEDKTEIRLRLHEGRDFTEYRFRRIVEEDKVIIKIRIVEEMNVIDIKVFIETDEETGEVTYRYHFFDGKEFFRTRKEQLNKVKKELEDWKNQIREKIENRIPGWKR